VRAARKKAMVGWGWAALAAAALALGAAPGEKGHGAPARPGGSVCELRGADRATTPSVRCMACHDGGAGQPIEFPMGGDQDSMSHPVDVDYAATAARHPDRYASPAALPREVPLVQGKVSCTSCHDGASPDPRHVAIPERLCQSCHRM
jgi:hypothetical protein